MKASNHFKNTIKTYLEQRAETDVLFSFQYSKPEKNIDDCVTYILNEVKKSGCNGFADDEIYSMAVHYYDEKDIKIGKPINCNVIVNHKVGKEKTTIKTSHKEQSAQIKKTAPKTKQELFDQRQLSLF